jgi:phosphoribosyl-AMP cyclohydrolase
MSDLPQTIRFDADGLVPVVAQDAVTGDVLMLAYMNDEALRLTAATGYAHYWSRGRQKLWRKGETSGHTQIVDEILVNCERNSLLLLVRQTGAFEIQQADGRTVRIRAKPSPRPRSRGKAPAP